ncbi:MAG: hypothetical protein GYB67_04355 [Chloroflexi bacterium]|nr:hypothetical protein [Chloroflexota bacterium]
MPQTFDFINLFVRQPGDLVYYLAVVAISQAGLFMALGQRLRHIQERAPARYAIASIGVVLAWALLMIGALFALLSSQPAIAILPPMERYVQIIAVLLLGWAFLSADNPRLGRAANLVLLGLLGIVTIGYIFTGVQWEQFFDNLDFNLSIYGVTWTYVGAALTFAGALLTLVYFRSISDAPLKMVYFMVLLVGFVGTLIQIEQGIIIGHYAGLIRLTFLASLLIMLGVIYRMVLGQFETEIIARTGGMSVTAATPTRTQPQATFATLVEAPAAGPAHVVTPSDRESAQLMKALGEMLENTSPEAIPDQIITAAINILRADIGALLVLQDANYADVANGYDKTMGSPISNISLNLDYQPTLVNALDRRSQRPLYPDRNEDELRDFYTRLDIDHVGPTYFQPLVNQQTLKAVLVLGLPYAKREFTDTEQSLLQGVGIIAAKLLTLSYDAQDASLQAEGRIIEAMIHGVPPDNVEDVAAITNWHDLRAELDTAREQVLHLTHQVTEMQATLDHERSRVATTLGDTEENLSISQRIVVMTEENQRLIEERDRLATRLREAETALAGAVSPDSEGAFKAMVAGLRRERDELQAQLDRLGAQLTALRTGDQEAASQSVQEMIDHMSADRDRLETERNAFRAKIDDIERQLEALGIEEGSAGLTQIIGQLYEQRVSLQARNDGLQRERDALLNERATLEEAIQREQERGKQILTLQYEITHLAADREAVTKQRERLRGERDALLARQVSFEEQQAQLTAELAGFEQELKEAHAEEAQLRKQIRTLMDERSSLTQERDRLLAYQSALQTDRDQLLARMEGDRERLQQLGVDGVGALTAMIEDLTEQRNQREQQLSEVQTELAAAEDELSVMRIRVNAQPQVAYQPHDPELFLGLIQELRTPMTSIVGYVALLMNESVGLVGENQRKFLKRISANVTRLVSMLDDLIRITFLDTGRYTLNRQRVDVVGVVEDALTSATEQLREKGLAVRLNLDEDLPPALVDPDAVSQIVGELLTNAYLASAPDSEIIITAERQSVAQPQNGSSEQAVDSLLISVEDRGGGIARGDRPFVFARRYQAENPLIEGLGDTGVGLAVAKALVEVHGGEIWFETNERVGTVFKFTLPLEPAAEVEH